jgi:hypothetical protein
MHQYEPGMMVRPVYGILSLALSLAMTCLCLSTPAYGMCEFTAPASSPGCPTDADALSMVFFSGSPSVHTNYGSKRSISCPKDLVGASLAISNDRTQFTE